MNTVKTETTEKKRKRSMTAETKFSMKLMVDKNAKRVLFAEAGKDCVDFLFFILSLPISTIIRLVGKQEMTGSVANLYESVEALAQTYFQPSVTKETLLKLPITPLLPGYSHLLDASAEASTEKQVYTCSSLKTPAQMQQKFQYNVFCQRDTIFRVCRYGSYDPRAVCSECKKLMSWPITYVAPPDTLDAAAQASTARKILYRCSSSMDGCIACRYVSDNPSTLCPHCHKVMSICISYVALLGVGGGFVKEASSLL